MVRLSRFRKCLLRSACLTAAVFMPTGSPSDVSQPPLDSRILKVDAFFESYGCPLPHHAGEYVRAADLYQIDYRVLPAISLLESTCGAFQRGNNHWGWNSAQTRFASVADGIDFITRQLALGDPYRDRDLDAKLFSYNPTAAYVRAVKRLIDEIDGY